MYARLQAKQDRVGQCHSQVFADPVKTNTSVFSDAAQRARPQKYCRKVHIRHTSACTPQVCKHTRKQKRLQYMRHTCARLHTNRTHARCPSNLVKPGLQLSVHMVQVAGDSHQVFADPGKTQAVHTHAHDCTPTAHTPDAHHTSSDRVTSFAYTLLKWLDTVTRSSRIR